MHRNYPPEILRTKHTTYELLLSLDFPFWSAEAGERETSERRREAAMEER